jgi:fermentation-respiration switch protein FrsA (DUF1100 family)
MLWLFLIFAVLVGIALLISLYTFRICFYAPADRVEDPYTQMQGEQYAAMSDSILRCTKIMDDAPSEWVQIRSHDGLSLSGRYYHTKDGAPVQIMFHGYRSMALRDSAGGYILAKKMGFNVLAVDQRAHGRSKGRVITFGIQERKDCLSWVQYAAKRFGKQTPIVLSGLSMGAATVLMAAGRELPDNVIGVLADCGYTSPKEIICEVIRQMKLPPKLSYPFVRLAARLFAGFDLEADSPLEAAARCKVPVILYHGEDDVFVPCHMSRRNYEACNARKAFITVPGAGHGLAYAVQPERYLQTLREFFPEE